MPLRLKHFDIEHPFTVLNAFLLSLVGCVVVTGVMLLGNLYTVDRSIPNHVHIVWWSILNFSLFFFVSIFNFHIFKQGLSPRRSLIVAGLGTIVITVACTLVSQAIRIWVYDEAFASGYLTFDVAKDALVGLTVFLISILLSSLVRRQKIVLENEQLQSENLLIRFQSLENQVDPHFLFNSLNTLDGLIGVDDDKAHRYLQQLASSYRYIMHQEKTVTLRDELEFARSYIYMMQIRYGANLTVVQRVDPSFHSALVVPISLQLLIENAVKHNVVSDRHPLSITIETTGRQTLRVSNPIHPKADQEAGNGIGLSNLNERYMLCFSLPIAISQSHDTFSVELPLNTHLS